MVTERELAGMRRALELSRKGRGRTSPNPSVGAVVLSADGEVVGEGWTEPPTGRHAEVVALDQAAARAAGGTVVSTLEPCSHVGRTGPCTAAIAKAGASRVVFGARDPHPAAAGGAADLRALGLEVEEGVLLDEALESLHPWLTSVRLGRPHVTWKSAQSLDARIAAGEGAPVWVSSQESRADAHAQLRAKADAIVIGSGTVRSDNPALTVRTGDPELDSRFPLRVVMDRSKTVAHEARVLTPPGESLHTSSSPHELLLELHARGAIDVLIEGGPTIGSAFYASGLVDRVVVYVAPVLLGTSGLPAMSARSGALDLLDATPVGPDLRLTYAVVH